MKLLRLGQFLSQLGQTLLVGRSRLGIKDFPGITEPFGVVNWQARVFKERSFTGAFPLRSAAYSDQGEDMELLGADVAADGQCSGDRGHL